VTIRYLPHKISPSGITGATFWSEQIGLLPHASQKKSAGLQTISLRRIPKELLAGRRVMLEYLRQMKISALRRDDKETSDLVDKTLAHWLSMGPMEEQFENPLAGTEFFSNLTSHVASISDMLDDLTERLGAIVDPAMLQPVVLKNEHLQKEVEDLKAAYAP